MDSNSIATITPACALDLPPSVDEIAFDDWLRDPNADPEIYEHRDGTWQPAAANDVSLEVRQAPLRDAALNTDVGLCNPQGADAIFTAAFPDVPMLIPGLGIGPGRANGIWAAPGGGKNIVAQYIGLAVATGREIFGRFSVNRGRVLHVTWDLGDAATKLRFRQLANGMGLAPSELEGRFELEAYPEALLIRPDALAVFRARFAGFDLVIIDNLRTAAPGVDENSSIFTGYVAILNAAAAMAGCTVIYLHHTRKTENGTVELPDGRGSGGITGASGTIWAIEGNGNDDRNFKNLRPHDMAVGLYEPLMLRLVAGDGGAFDTGAFTPRALSLEGLDAGDIQAAEQHAKDEFAEGCVLRAIRENPGIGAEALRTKVRGQAEKTDACVQRLLAAGKIEDRGGGGKRAPREYYLVVPAGSQK